MGFELNDIVRVKAELSRTQFIASKQLKAGRQPGALGHILTLTDRYAVVSHPHGAPTAYLLDELEPANVGYWRAEYEVSGNPYFAEFATYDEVVSHCAHYDISTGSDKTVIAGPFFDEHVLSQGFLTPKSLYEHLLDDDTDTP